MGHKYYRVYTYLCGPVNRPAGHVNDVTVSSCTAYLFRIRNKTLGICRWCEMYAMEMYVTHMYVVDILFVVYR
jgi:hypothetical protein